MSNVLWDALTGTNPTRIRDLGLREREQIELIQARFDRVREQHERADAARLFADVAVLLSILTGRQVNP